MSVNEGLWLSVWLPVCEQHLSFNLVSFPLHIFPWILGWLVFFWERELVACITASLCFYLTMPFNEILVLAPLHWWSSFTGGSKTPTGLRKTTSDSFLCKRKKTNTQSARDSRCGDLFNQPCCRWMLLSIECIDCWWRRGLCYYSLRRTVPFPKRRHLFILSSFARFFFYICHTEKKWSRLQIESCRTGSVI